MKIVSFLCIVFSVVAISCNDCTDCEPFDEEPFVLVRFYNLADSTRRTIIIDSVNQTATGTLRHFNDTTYSFRFPLDMNNDQSEFKLVYREPANPDIYLTNELIFSYSRTFIRRDDNYIILQCNINGIISDFPLYALECKASEANECLSNDAKTSLYY